MTEEKNSLFNLSPSTGGDGGGFPTGRDGVGPIFLIGFMGCGKSYWGQQLSEQLHLPFIDLDERIEAQEGKTISEIFAALGEEHFRRLEKETLHLITESHGAFVMATGGGTPCFYNNIDYLKKRGTVVWLDCPVSDLKRRLVGEKDKRPLIATIPDSELEAYITRKLADRRIFYQQAQVILQNDITLPDLLQKVGVYKMVT